MLVALWVMFAVFAQADEGTERLQWLRAEIARHDELYFKKAAPEISDAEYDALKREMRALEKNAAQAVGDDRSGEWPSYRHRERMLSLEKTYTEAELRAWLKNVEGKSGAVVWVVEPKFDGLAISVTYEQGKLVRAVTRGNGEEGDDVTANVLGIAGVVRALPAGAPDVVEVRGEIYLSWDEFRRINAERVEAGEEVFAHPRNLAAGTLKSKDAAEVAKRKLSAVFYGLGAWQGAAKKPESQQALTELVKTWGLPGVETVAVVKTDDVWGAVETFGRERKRLGFPTDGAVVKVDSRAVQEQLGANEEAPRWAVAFKYPPDRVTTRLKAITLQVGRTGVITPVAELEPVKIGGTTVARATLHNADEIARRDLRIGDYVFVEKAGEIIPAITGVDVARRGDGVVAFAFPEKCQVCETTLVRDGAAVRCPNAQCVAQVRKRIEFFASPAGVGIKGLGPALIERLVADGKLKGLADIYKLKKEDGVSERVLVEIERSRSVELGRFLAGLGVAKKRAMELMDQYRDLRAMAGELSEDARALVAAGVNPLSLRGKK
jgi:DNA ligase (NAD+)